MKRKLIFFKSDLLVVTASISLQPQEDITISIVNSAIAEHN